MRYGNPSMNSVLEKMRLANYDQLIIFPLYPQYASATTGSIIEKAFKIISNGGLYRNKSDWTILDDYRYLDCVKKVALSFDLSEYDHVLFHTRSTRETCE